MNYLKTFLPYLFGNKKGKSLETSLPDPIPWASLGFEEILMFHTLKNTLNQYIRSIDLKTLSPKNIYHLLNFQEYFNHDLYQEISSFFSKELSLYKKATKSNPLKAHELQELFDFNNQCLTVFALLKSDRTKPGVLVLRAPDGKFVTDSCQNVWSIPILALSGRGLPFNHSNGSTPTGIFSIDSVMPEANKNFEFGQHRRLIVNFIPESQDESDLKILLPVSHTDKSWWAPCVLGREIGRSLLRIHGTGRKNLNPLSSYFPLVPTSGCLATNEATFFGYKKARDQRLLLDHLMLAQNIDPTHENESKIHGLLYVVELDDNLAALRFFI
ncbi:MAG: hypothetical protein Q7U04_04710 [Bacteriovorax sp.]|nr:hypothetical protein [Bacteriovorax sp.]